MAEYYEHTIFYQVCNTKFKLEVTHEELDDFLDQLNAVDADFIDAANFDEARVTKTTEQQGLRLSKYVVEAPEEELSEDI